MPTDMPEVTLTVTSNHILIAHLLKEAGLTASTGEAMRMIQQGGVKIDGQKVSDKGLQIPVTSNHVYQVGKRRFARVIVNTN